MNYEFNICIPCAFIVEGPDVNDSADLKFYLQWLAAKKDDGVGTQGSRSYNSGGAQSRSAVNSKVGPMVGRYDPELASALGLDGS